MNLSATDHVGPALREGYLQRSKRPLQSLVFLAPFLIVYELGTFWLLRAPDPESVTPFIRARVLLNDLFERLGTGSYYLPVIVLVVVLLTLHLTNRDPWRVDWRTAVGMFFESVGLAIPLMLFVVLLVGRPAPPAADDLARADFVFAIGAGIYEELVFRLIAIALLHLLVVDLLRAPKRVGDVVAVLGSAVLFAGYHFPTFDDFVWPRFLYYFAAGTYFALIYVNRGFGIVAAAHALYDILFVIMKYQGD